MYGLVIFTMWLIEVLPSKNYIILLLFFLASVPLKCHQVYKAGDMKKRVIGCKEGGWEPLWYLTPLTGLGRGLG